MIAEEREKEETWERECIQALEAYLRQEFDAKSIKNTSIYNAAVQRLYMKAIDWGYAHNVEVAQDKANELANEAIQRYSHNWQNKKQGEDIRGDHFGKSSYL